MEEKEAGLLADGVIVLPDLHHFEPKTISGRVVRGGQFKLKEPADPTGAERFLPLVEAYYGHPAKRITAELITSWPVQEMPFGSQLWHRDTEGGPKQLRAMCYLTDVTLENGPLCYVPGSTKSETFGRFTDEEFDREVYASGYWQTYTGPSGTVILFDTMGFHRGLPNVSGKREALCFTYHAR
jgi:ectoine hydroxylase-related dioxygenase (phytanoyl-CoA dioxygenase family)